MELKPNHNSPVLADPVPVNKSRLSLSSTLLPYSKTATGFSSPGLYLTIPIRKPVSGNFEDVRAAGWLDSMQSSSPPHKKAFLDSGFELESDDAEAVAFRSWLLKYSSALTSFEQIISCAKGKKIALFLDFDGTLSPIVDNPEHTFMSSAHFPTAIISGRSRDTVYDFIGLTELYYAGSHGMDIMGPVHESDSIADHPYCIRSTDKQGKEVRLFQPASEFLPMINEVFRTLVESTNDIQGAKVDNNKFCVSVHYRLVDKESWPLVAQTVCDILKDYPRLKLTHGRKVLEVRPDIEWNKGKAVEFLLKSLGLSNPVDVLPIYVGDDKTD